MKSVEAILAEIQPPIQPQFFERQSVEDLQKLTF